MEPSIISTLLKSLIGSLASLLTKRVISLWDLPNKLTQLQRQLIDLSVLLQAVEKCRSPIVQHWKQDVMDVIFDLEDLLDDIGTEESRGGGREKPMVIKTVRRILSLNPLFPPGYYYMVDDIMKNIDRIKAHHNFVEQHVGSLANEKWTDPSCSALDREFIGRSDETQKIVDFLLNNEDNTLSILGMGGLGKTALAQKVLDDVEVKENFDEVKWAHVSFIEMKLDKIIAEILGKKKTKDTLETLRSKLLAEIVNKNCLFVLDDVWDMAPNDWKTLKSMLQINKANKILITTRYRQIAKLADKVIELEPLPPQYCLPLIEEFAGRRIYSPISDTALEKCEGVPLAAMSLGVKLSSTERVEANDAWGPKDLETKDDIMYKLKLSYDNLEPRIRSCFAYHTMCNENKTDGEKDCPMDKEKLIQMWIAQGFMEQTDEDLEANRIFEVLESASFFYDVEEGISDQGTTFRALELFRHLAFLVSKEYSCIRDLNRTPLVPSTTRHVQVSLTPEPPIQEVKEHKIWKKLRTFIGPENITSLSRIQQVEELETWKKLRTFIGRDNITRLSKFRRLRVLDLCVTQFENLPGSIGDLKHLRYLDVSRNQCLQGLPNSIGKLINLKSLRVNKCTKLKGLPDDIRKLRNLKQLYITSKQKSFELKSFSLLQTLHLENFDRLVKLPKISELTTLNTLGIFDCPKLRFQEDDMKGIKNLRWLALVNLPNLKNLPNFASLTSLQRLTIEGCYDLSSLTDENNRKLLPDSLSVLHIHKCSKLTNLPTWFASLTSLQRLTIEGCSGLLSLADENNEKLLPDSLSVLHIHKCSKLTNLPTWFASLTFLQRLTIEGCSGLLSLADENNEKLLPDSLSVLHIDDCSLLTERCRGEEGEDWSKINHVKEIFLNKVRIQPIPDPDESSTLPSSSSDCHELNRRSEIERGNEEEGNIQYVNDIATSTSDGHGPAAQASDIEEAEKDIIKAIPVSSAAASKGKSIMTTVDQPKIVLSSSPPKKLMSDAMKGAARALMKSNNQKAERQIHGHEPAARASEIEETEEDTIEDHILFPEILGKVSGSVVKEANRGDDAVAREAGKQAAFACAGESSADPQPSDAQVSLMRNSTNSTAEPTINQGASLPHESNGTRFEISDAGDSGEGPSCVQQSLETCQNSAAQLHYSNEEGSPLPHQTHSTRIGTPMSVTEYVN